MLIHESQSGFRPKHSCQTALIKLIDQWKECIDKGDIVGTLFIDFRKTFDVVDHNILLRKLQIYKFSPNAIRWFQSYLEYRQQALVTDNGLSEYAQVRSGVPQGSILGPTLFLLFINDLPLSLQYCSSDFYADDATFHTHDKDIHTIENRIQSDFNASKLWSTSNKMHIHYQKTSCMTIGTRQRLVGTDHLNIKADNINIRSVSNQKLLGLYIDENLNWNTHIDNLCKAVSSKISLLRQLAEFAPLQVQKQFYQGYILPLLDYGSITWGSTSSANIERLSKLQKRAARIILKADFDTPSVLMFQKLDWLSVRSRIKYNKAVVINKALNNMTPDYITKLLIPMSQTHSLNLRSGHNGTISNDIVSTKIYDKRDDFDFEIVNFPFLDGDVPRSTSYGVYISQLIRFARASSYVADFNTRNKLLTQKLLKQGYRYHKIRKTFSKFYRRYYDLISKFQVGLKSLLRQGLSEPDFYGDLVYKLKKIVGSNNFSAQFIKIISHYKKIGYNINVLQQTACLVVNPITVGSFAFLFNCTPVGRTSDSIMVPT